MMHIGQGTGFVLVGCEVGLEPPDLRGDEAAAAYLQAFVAVEGHDVPSGEVVGIVALGGVAGGILEVIEVPFGAFGLVFVVAGDRKGAVLEPAPGRVVALAVVLGRPLLVGVVAQGNDRAVYGSEQVRRRLVAAAGAAGYVACSDEDRDVQTGTSIVGTQRVSAERAAPGPQPPARIARAKDTTAADAAPLITTAATDLSVALASRSYDDTVSHSWRYGP